MSEEVNAEKLAEKALRARLHLIRQIDPGDDIGANHATARNVLHEELGQFGTPSMSYALDDRTRDILLVHARQDAAWAALNAKTAVGHDLELKRLLKLAILLLSACTAFLAGLHGRAQALDLWGINSSLGLSTDSSFAPAPMLQS